MPRSQEGWAQAAKGGLIAPQAGDAPVLDEGARCACGCPINPALLLEHVDAQLRSKLSVREAEVALLVVRGFSNGMIGKRLFISMKTVKTHVYSVFVKMEVYTRGELAAMVLFGQESATLANARGAAKRFGTGAVA